MSQQFSPYQTGHGLGPSTAPSAQYSILVFLRGLATPVVLYTDNPTQLFEEIKQVIRQADPKAPKLIEKSGVGPLKKVSFLDIELTGVAIQADPALR